MSAFVKSIIILAFTASGIELLMPQEAYKKYCKAFMGILMIMAIINPAAALINGDLSIKNPSLGDGAAYEEQFDLAVLSQFSEKLSLKLSEMMDGEETESDFNIIKKGAGYEIISVTVKTKNFQRAKELLVKTFGIKEDRIIEYKEAY